MAVRVLIVEDDTGLREFCALVLERAGYEVVQAECGKAGQDALRSSSFDVVVTDLKMPLVGGLEVLRTAKQIDPDTAVILITGHPTVETAVKAMKSGASDFLLKPFTAEQLAAAVKAPLENRHSREAYGILRRELRKSVGVGGLVGRSDRMLQLFHDVQRAAAVDMNVLILGESGVGKEVVAKAIHDESIRRDRPFVPLNCAAIPEPLLEAEIFGYERGAFTGAQTSREGLLEFADKGTLLLDEICEMNPLLQAKLLRALEEGNARRVGGRKPVPFDVRFVAATNRNIRDEIRIGRFRQDLFFRIDVIEIEVPPLRDRPEDIPLLAAHFLEAAAGRRRPKLDGIRQEALDILMAHDWPGNARELRNAVERAAAYAKGPFIELEDLPQAVRTSGTAVMPGSFREWKERMLERLEQEFLRDALMANGGNVSRAARALQINRSTLQRRMRKQGSPAA
jgi:DNA-binding NtrC family response regulator